MKFSEHMSKLLSEYPLQFMDENKIFGLDVMLEMFDGTAEALFKTVSALAEKCQTFDERERLYKLLRNVIDGYFARTELELSCVTSEPL